MSSEKQIKQDFLNTLIELKSNPALNKYEFYYFLDKTPKASFSDSNISKMRSAAMEKKYEFPIEKFEQFILLFEQYKDSKKNTSDTNTFFPFYYKDPHTENFFNTNWEVYFFYLSPVSETKIGLGRAFLKIGNNENTVDFYNIKDEISKNYKGRFWKLNDILFFHLEAEKEDGHVHIKALVKTAPSEISLAMYLSREIKTITSGTMILKQSSETSVEPKMLDSKVDPQAFEALDEQIKEFLAVKKRNFSKLPANIYTFKNLEEKMQSYQPTRKAFFYSPIKPTIYISCPISFLQKEENYISTIEEFKEELEKDFFVTVHFIGKDHSPKLRHKAVIKTLEKTTLFILIYPESIASTSLLELGWAIYF